MRRLLRLAPLVAASFVAGVVVPRAPVWHHHHEGGEHAHVHLDGPSWDHDDDDDHDHDHDHRHHAHDDGPGIEAPESADHVHWQQPFLRADRAPAPQVVRIDRIAWLPAIHAGEPVAPSRPAPRSRGPPSL
jgi:hypothetical protein